MFYWAFFDFYFKKYCPEIRRDSQISYNIFPDDTVYYAVFPVYSW